MAGTLGGEALLDSHIPVLDLIEQLANVCKTMDPSRTGGPLPALTSTPPRWNGKGHPPTAQAKDHTSTTLWQMKPPRSFDRSELPRQAIADTTGPPPAGLQSLARPSVPGARENGPSPAADQSPELWPEGSFFRAVASADQVSRMPGGNSSPARTIAPSIRSPVTGQR